MTPFCSVLRKVNISGLHFGPRGVELLDPTAFPSGDFVCRVGASNHEEASDSDGCVAGSGRGLQTLWSVRRRWSHLGVPSSVVRTGLRRRVTGISSAGHVRRARRHICRAECHGGAFDDRAARRPRAVVSWAGSVHAGQLAAGRTFTGQLNHRPSRVLARR